MLFAINCTMYTVFLTFDVYIVHNNDQTGKWPFKTSLGFKKPGVVGAVC